MKIFYCIMLAISTALVCSDASAQERGFGRGRLLKRIRQDIEKSQEKIKQQFQKQEPTAADQAKNAPKGKIPTPAIRPNTSERPSAPAANRNFPIPANSLVARQKSPPANDFGMVISTNKNDELVITSVEPNGNAVQAGIRPGDKIIGLGGAEVSAIEELKSISEILRPGDQMEFTIDSRGKTAKKMIQWGTAPEANEGEWKERGQFNANDSLKSIVDPVSAESTPASRARYENPLNRTIQEQRLRIQELERQIRQRRSSESSRQNPTSPILNGPSLTGPER